MVLPFASPSPFSLGSRTSRGSSLFLNPRASVCLSVGPTQSTVRGRPLATWVTSVPVRFVYPMCPENDIRATPIGIVDTSGGLAGLVLALSKCLVNQDSETNQVFLGEGISFIDRESLS